MVEIQQTAEGTLDLVVDKGDMLLSLLAMGFSIAMVVIVIVAAARIGWAIAPWVLGIGLLAYLFM